MLHHSPTTPNTFLFPPLPSFPSIPLSSSPLLHFLLFPTLQFLGFLSSSILFSSIPFSLSFNSLLCPSLPSLPLCALPSSSIATEVTILGPLTISSIQLAKIEGLRSLSSLRGQPLPPKKGNQRRGEKVWFVVALISAGDEALGMAVWWDHETPTRLAKSGQ